MTVRRTIPSLLEAAQDRWAERPFLLGSPDLNYGACVQEAKRAAGALAERGVRRGDRVVILVANGPEFLFAWWGANLLGAIAVPPNTGLRDRELAALIEHADPTAIVGAEYLDGFPLARQAAPGLRTVLVSGGADPAESFARAREQAQPREAVDVAEDDVAVIIYTSGTTGKPKGVMQTHRTYAMTGESFGWWLGLGEQERLWTCLPLYHINAQAYSTMGAVGGGYGLVLRQKFSASSFWDDIRASGATEFNAIGAVIHILLKQPRRDDDADNPARLCYAALALPEAQHREFEERFGLKMVVGYGLSESTFGTVWPKDERPRYGGIGRLRQHPTLGEVNRGRVVAEDGSDVPPGSEGELWLQNPAIMAGYFRDEERTREVVVDGWLHTGDLVRRDADGWLTFVSRKGDVIRRRGENMSAAEIEICLGEHPAVQECAVIGVPSELGEDEVKAYVVPAPGASIRPEEIAEWCSARLAPFKVPRFVEVRESLPKTETQRVAKHLLKQEAATASSHGWDRLAVPGARR